MEYKITKKEHSLVRIDFTVDAKEWDDLLNEAYNKTKDKYKVMGFRQGKAPRKMIERSYGDMVFLDEAFNIAFSRYYSKALDENTDIEPIDQPSADIEDIGENGIKFFAQFTVRPEVVLGAYKGIKIPKIEYNVTEAEIDAEINRIRERSARFETVEKKAENGDFVMLDYSGSIDGVAFSGGTAENQQLELGSKTFIDGFEEQLIGLGANDEKDVKVRFPDDYGAQDLAGKDAVFAVKIHSVKQKQMPELDDAFAKDVSSFDTFAEYRNSVASKLQASAEQRAKHENENKMLEAISAETKVEIPSVMVDMQLDYMLEDFEHSLSHQGLKLEDYFKYTNSSADEFRKARREDAEKTVKLRLTADEIIKAEKLIAEKEEMDAKLEAEAKRANKDVKDFVREMGMRYINYIANQIVMDKFLKFLEDNNEFVLEDKTSEEKPKKTAATKSTKVSAKSTKTSTKKDD